MSEEQEHFKKSLRAQLNLINYYIIHCSEFRSKENVEKYSKLINLLIKAYNSSQDVYNYKFLIEAS